MLNNKCSCWFGSSYSPCLEPRLQLHTFCSCFVANWLPGDGPRPVAKSMPLGESIIGSHPFPCHYVSACIWLAPCTWPLLLCTHGLDRHSSFMMQSGCSVYLQGRTLCWHPVPLGTPLVSSHGIKIVAPCREAHTLPQTQMS